MHEQQEQKGTMHEIQGKATNGNHIDMVTINSIGSKLKTSSSQNSTIILYKIDAGSDGNIMSIHIFRMFPKATKE